MEDSLQVDNAEEIDTIDGAGDVVLSFRSETEKLHHSFRCSRKSLGIHSEYFRVLLDPHKFSEGLRTAERLKELCNHTGAGTKIRSSELPVVTINTLPILSAKQQDFRRLLRFLLLLMSDQDCPWPFVTKESIERLAQLAILSEAFGAIGLLKNYAETADLYSHFRSVLKLDMPESLHRRWLLVGLLFDRDTHVRVSSAVLVVKGSKLWVQHSSGAEIRVDEQPAWNNLPFGIEEELQVRRQCVIDTLASLQSHFVTMYSRHRQCKKGYSNSLECDSFHLGEAVKFFTQKGSLTVQGAFTEHEPQIFEGDLGALVTNLRRCPSYQLDPYHAHCGVRQRLLPILDRFDLDGQVGICIRCWKTDRAGESWSESPASEVWSLPARVTPRWACTTHSALKAMYTAPKRDWTPSDP